MPSHTCVCPPAGFAQPPWPNPARNILRLGFRARDHFDIWAKSGPCPASYKAVHGWAELVADHATAGFGLPMAQTPLPVAGGMRCRCSIVRILRFPKLGSRSLLLGPAPGEKWSCVLLGRLTRTTDTAPGPARRKNVYVQRPRTFNLRNLREIIEIIVRGNSGQVDQRGISRNCR